MTDNLKYHAQKNQGGNNRPVLKIPSVHSKADDCFEAMQRHHARGRQAVAMRQRIDNTPLHPETVSFVAGGHGGNGGGNGNGNGIVASAASGGPGSGDIIYGAKAIARFMFGDDSNRARRRVFNLWAFYEKRREKAGFFKLKGALCLSKALWRRYHGLD